MIHFCQSNLPTYKVIALNEVAEGESFQIEFNDDELNVALKIAGKIQEAQQQVLALTMKAIDSDTKVQEPEDIKAFKDAIATLKALVKGHSALTVNVLPKNSDRQIID